MLLLSFPTKVCICIYPSNSPSFQGVSFESFQLLLCARGDTATVAVGAAEGLVEDVEAALALRPLRWTLEVKYQGWGWMGMDDGWGFTGGEKKLTGEAPSREANSMKHCSLNQAFHWTGFQHQNVNLFNANCNNRRMIFRVRVKPTSEERMWHP